MFSTKYNLIYLFFFHYFSKIKAQSQIYNISAVAQFCIIKSYQSPVHVLQHFLASRFVLIEPISQAHFSFLTPILFAPEKLVTRCLICTPTNGTPLQDVSIVSDGFGFRDATCTLSVYKGLKYAKKWDRNEQITNTILKCAPEKSSVEGPVSPHTSPWPSVSTRVGKPPCIKGRLLN